MRPSPAAVPGSCGPSPPHPATRPGPVSGRSPESLIRFAFTYLCGPLAPLVLPQERRNRFWSTLAILWVVAGGGGVWWASSIWSVFRNGSLPVLYLVAATTGWFVAGGLCWAWGVARVGRDLGNGAALPDWRRSAGLIGGTGFFAPGAGLILAGYPRRGGAVVAGIGLFLAAVFLLLLGSSLWRANLACGGAGMPGSALEWLLLGAAGTVVLGTLVWLVQVLDGIRLTSRRFRGRAFRSDSLTWLLLIVMVVAPWFLHPSQIAGTAERWATSLEEEGLRITPLLLVRGALWVDPGQPLHALHAARLHEALGHVRQARSLREDLLRRWATIGPAIFLTGEPASAPDGQKAADFRLFVP
jgi:hypothetical protein